MSFVKRTVVTRSTSWYLMRCLLPALGLAIAPAVAPADLVGHWKLDEAPGSTTTVDSSGTWPDGTLSGGPQFVPGKAGNALSFDGADDLVSAVDPLTLDLTGPLTLSVWVDLNGDPSSGTGQIAGQNTYGGGASDVFYLEYDKGTDTFTFTIAHNGGTRVALDSTTTFTNTDGFVHLAGVFDPGASMKLYIDGMLDATRTDAAVPAAAQVVHVPFTIGRLNNDAGQFTFNGLIDDVQLYDDALSPADIQTLFNNPGVALGAIPEPSTVVLAAIGLLALVGCGWRRRSRS